MTTKHIFRETADFEESFAKFTKENPHIYVPTVGTAPEKEEKVPEVVMKHFRKVCFVPHIFLNFEKPKLENKICY